MEVTTSMNLKIFYDSCTGNVERFSTALPFPAERIQNDIMVKQPYVLITYTTNFGQVPEKTEKFLAQNGNFLQAVVVSGNRNWGTLFGKCGDTIAERYHVPLLHKFELSGTATDRSIVKQKIEEIANATAH